MEEEDSIKQQMEQMSFNVEGGAFSPYEDDQHSTDKDRDDTNDYYLNYPFDQDGQEDSFATKGKHRAQGLSISDIPHNVFNPEPQHQRQEKDSLFKQDSFENQYKETTHFGQFSSGKVSNHKSPQTPEENELDDQENADYNSFLAAHFYGDGNAANTDEDNSGAELRVSPIKDEQFNDRYGSPDQKGRFDEVKSKTCLVNSAIDKDNKMRRSRPVELGFTERSSYNPSYKMRQPKFSMPISVGAQSKGRRSHQELFSNRETIKSESSWVPTFSKMDFEEEYNGISFKLIV